VIATAKLGEAGVATPKPLMIPETDLRSLELWLGAGNKTLATGGVLLAR